MFRLVMFSVEYSTYKPLAPHCSPLGGSMVYGQGEAVNGPDDHGEEATRTTLAGFSIRR